MKNSQILFIASYAPPSLSGAAQNMYYLLQGMPANSYYIMTSFYNIDQVSLKLGRWLDGQYIFYDRPTATRELLQQSTHESSATEPRRTFAIRLKNIIRKLPLMGALTGIPVIGLQTIDIVRVGRRLIKEKGSDILLGFSDYGPAMLGTYLLHKITRKPIWIFLFDIYKGNNYFFPGNQLANWLEPRLMRVADKIIVTNQGTKEFYQQRYTEALGQKIVVVHNSAIPGPYLANQTPYQPHSPYTILFTGSIYWPQIRSLQNLVQAVNEINDLDIKVKLYAPHPRAYIESYGLGGPKVEIRVAAPGEMARLQSQADILFLPLSWQTKSPGIIDTATPGKLADYLIAGRPMLIHAPATTTLVKYAKAHQFAYVVDREDIKQLKQAIRRLLLDIPLAHQLIANAKATFVQNHDAKKNALVFRSLFGY